jgi:hypothetical protein
VGQDGIRKVRDDGETVPHVESLIGRGVNGWGGVRKSGGRVRT